MSDLVLGVDPGKRGALAFLYADNGTLLEAVDMPDWKGAALGAALSEVCAGWSPHRIVAAWVEKVGSRPNQGHMNVWTFAESYGVLLGVLGARRIPVRYVTPNVWKPAMGVTKDKTSSRDAAAARWPSDAHLFRRVKDDGRAEACLIAEYGRQQGGR